MLHGRQTSNHPSTGVYIPAAISQRSYFAFPVFWTFNFDIVFIIPHHQPSPWPWNTVNNFSLLYRLWRPAPFPGCHSPRSVSPREPNFPLAPEVSITLLRALATAWPGPLVSRRSETRGTALASMAYHTLTGYA